MVLVSGSENTRATRAGASDSLANRSGSGDHGTMSMRSPLSSFTTACTREPLRPTHAPTGSIESSREETAILVRLPASRAVARISTMLCWISGTSSLNSAFTNKGSAPRSEEHTSELQSLAYLVCRLLLEKKKKKYTRNVH